MFRRVPGLEQRAARGCEHVRPTPLREVSRCIAAGLKQKPEQEELPRVRGDLRSSLDPPSVAVPASGFVRGAEEDPLLALSRVEQDVAVSEVLTVKAVTVWVSIAGRIP